MFDFETQSRGLFNRFASKLAKVDLRLAAALPAMAGAMLACYGVGMEAHGQAQLLLQGGAHAIDAYNQMVQSHAHQLGLNPDSIVDLITHGLKGDLASFGSNTQMRGITMMGAGPALSIATLMLARGFNSLSDKVQSLLMREEPKVSQSMALRPRG